MINLFNLIHEKWNVTQRMLGHNALIGYDIEDEFLL